MANVGRSTKDRSGPRHGKETPDSYKPSRDGQRVYDGTPEKRKQTDGMIDTNDARTDAGDYEGGQ